MKRVLFSLILIVAASAVASAQTFYFPQIAAGDGWMTTIFLSNATADKVASGTVTSTTSAGAPFNAHWVDEAWNNVGNGNTISFQIAPGQTVKYMAVSDIPLTVGYAKVTANASVLGTAMFTLLDSNGGIISEAGVPMGIPLGKQAVFVDTTNGFRTGVAIANPNSASLDLNLELLDTNGHVVARTVRVVPPFQHLALFSDELFPDVPPMVGRLQFWCTNPVVAVALRFTPWAQFTTMSPIVIAN
jgi:hypothetical protein